MELNFCLEKRKKTEKNKPHTCFSGKNKKKKPKPTFLEKYYILVFPPATFILGSASALMSQAPHECSDPFTEIPGSPSTHCFQSLSSKALPKGEHPVIGILSLALSPLPITDVLRTSHKSFGHSPLSVSSLAATQSTPSSFLSSSNDFCHQIPKKNANSLLNPPAKPAVGDPGSMNSVMDQSSLLRNQDALMKEDVGLIPEYPFFFFLIL